MIIRFDYCPPNPGTNAYRRWCCNWYSDIQTAIDNYDGYRSIWIKTGDVYEKISYDELFNLK